MRWMIACMCWLLLPLPGVAKRHVSPPPVSLRYPGSQDIPTVLALGGLGEALSPADALARPAQMHWAVERVPPPEHFHLPKVHLGNSLVVGYHRREVTVSQGCWQVTLRAFSKISVFCRSSF